MIPPGYFDLVRRRESGGNDNARNPLSTASGRNGFLDSTFVNTLSPLMPGKSPQEILALKNDPYYQDKALEAFSLSNANALKNAGIEPTSQNLYLAHHFGAGGATKLLQADPNTPLTQLFGPEVFKANPYMNNIPNAQGLIAKWSGQGGGGGDMIRNNTGGAQNVYQGDEQGWNAADFFGNNLVNAGAAIASISSPAAAAAISKLASSSDSDYQTSISQETGQIIRVNKKTGQTQVIDAPQLRQQYQANQDAQLQRQMQLYRGKEELKRPSDKFLAEATNAWKEAGASADVAQRADRLLDALDRGVLNPSIISRAKDTIGSVVNMPAAERARILGVTEEQADLLSEIERFKNQSLLKAQLEQKGVATEGDAIRITRSQFADLDPYDPIKLRGALSGIMTGLEKSYKDNAMIYEGRRKAYANNPALDNPEMTARLAEGAPTFDRFRQREEARKKAQTESGTKTNQDRRSLFESIWGN